FDLLCAESRQPKLVLLRQAEELYSGPFLLNPPHFTQINLHGRPLVQVHLERNVLIAPEEFCERKLAPSAGNICHLSTYKSYFVRDDCVETCHLPNVHPSVHPVNVTILYRNNGQYNLITSPCEALLHMRL